MANATLVQTQGETFVKLKATPGDAAHPHINLFLEVSGAGSLVTNGNWQCNALVAQQPVTTRKSFFSDDLKGTGLRPLVAQADGKIIASPAGSYAGGFPEMDGVGSWNLVAHVFHDGAQYDANSIVDGSLLYRVEIVANAGSSLLLDFQETLPGKWRLHGRLSGNFRCVMAQRVE